MSWSLCATSELSDTEFVQWNRLLGERSGIQLAATQKTLLQSRVAVRMREVGYDNYEDYYRFVTDGLQGVIEWSILIDRIAVKETSFFRHRPSFDHVRSYLQNKINSNDLKESFDVWSVGCSTGEEPYSLAMLVNDCIELAHSDSYYGITAFDISTTAIATAKRGCYSERSVGMLAEHEFNHYCNLCDSGEYGIIRKLKDRICFSQANIVEMRSMPKAKVDVIFCQNLLVYFRRWLRRDILNTFVERLKPGGLLVIGLGEAVDWEHPKVTRVKSDAVQAYICTQ